MSETTARVLALLNLLQVHRHWPGGELAARLGVTDRTVRRDIERLRELGYHIESTPGAAGGYRLRAGSAMPPLLLTDDEAVALAVGLRLAATQRLVGGAETTLTALAKLEQVLPRALRHRVAALAGTIRPMGVERGTGAPPERLSELALCCRDAERVRFHYTSAGGQESDRLTEPHYLVPSDRHWYLVCWDVDRADWRTFRIDRMSDLRNTRWRFRPRELTPEQAEQLVAGAARGRRASVAGAAVLELPLAAVHEAFGPWGGAAEAVTDERTRWPLAVGDLPEAAYVLSWIPVGVEYAVDLPEEHRRGLAEILERMLRGLRAGDPSADPLAGDQLET